LADLEATVQRKTTACDKLEAQIKRRIQQQQEHARAKRQQLLLLHTMVANLAFMHWIWY
jgi:multidrug resistance efflux pump